ncbi:MAG: outer membrane protein assembly factor BamD [Gammaproteobacteria bacterium]|nr:outer membrane protein assembly factor BamD [Gammaproteobacteria bacterium]
MRIRIYLLAAVVAALAGCSSSPSKTASLPADNPFKLQDNAAGDLKQKRISELEAKLKAQQLYHLAHNQLESSEFGAALKTYDKVIEQFPFTNFATQSEVEKIYAQYRSFQFDEATSEADRFLREHPRHADAAYVQYLKGLIDSAQNDSLLDYLPLSPAQRDVGSKEKAFSEFGLLVQRYPNSIYAADARKRMIALRNEIAAHEVAIAHFYLSRGAYLAAARRAEEVVARYPGAPATAEALSLAARCYSELGLNDQKHETATLIAVNRPAFLALKNPPKAAVAAAAPTAAPTSVPAKTLRLARLNDWEAVATDAPPPATPASAATAPAPARHRGWLSRFAGLFSWMDTTKAENRHVITLGGTPAAAASAPAAQTAVAEGATAAPVATAAARTAAAGQRPIPGTGLTVSVGPDPADEWHPLDQPATPGSAAADPTPAGVRSQHLSASAQARNTAGERQADCGLFSRVWYFVTFRSCPSQSGDSSSTALKGSAALRADSLRSSY